MKAMRAITSLSLFSISLLFSNILFAQEVLKPRIQDGVYTKEIWTKRKWDLDRSTIFVPVYSFDTIGSAISEEKIRYYKKYFQKAPLQLEECVYINPGRTDIINKIIHPPEKGISPQKPFSFILYSDTLSYNDKNDELSGYSGYLKLYKPLEDYYEPFYFKKTEVSNKEYREFVAWVRDSIPRRALSEDGRQEFFQNPEDPKTNVLNHKKTIPWSDPKTYEVLEFMYLPIEERFYKRKELDPRIILYRYTTKDINEVIYVYPDTLTWVHHFSSWSMEPMTNMYFWHPAFDHYPVVGITQLQAKAFLIWKTKQEQEALNKKNSDYIIKYELPNEIEWEMVATAGAEDHHPVIYSQELSRLYDRSYITDITLKSDTSFVVKKVNHGGERNPQGNFDAIEIYFHELFTDEMNKKPLKSTYLQLDKYVPPYLYNELFSYKIMYSKKRKNYPRSLIGILKDENEICFMGGNVSEWMLDTYQENWLAAFTYHQNKLKKINTPDVRLLIAVEEYYNSKNDPKGVLIRGGNWYDYSEAITAGKNFEGINKKRFADPNKAYPTVGFRYVVKVYRKDEQIKKNIK